MLWFFACTLFTPQKTTSLQDIPRPKQRVLISRHASAYNNPTSKAITIPLSNIFQKEMIGILIGEEKNHLQVQIPIGESDEYGDRTSVFAPFEPIVSVPKEARVSVLTQPFYWIDKRGLRNILLPGVAMKTTDKGFVPTSFDIQTIVPPQYVGTSYLPVQIEELEGEKQKTLCYNPDKKPEDIGNEGPFSFVNPNCERTQPIYQIKEKNTKILGLMAVEKWWYAEEYFDAKTYFLEDYITAGLSGVGSSSALNCQRPRVAFPKGTTAYWEDGSVVGPATSSVWLYRDTIFRMNANRHCTGFSSSIPNGVYFCFDEEDYLATETLQNVYPILRIAWEDGVLSDEERIFVDKLITQYTDSTEAQEQSRIASFSTDWNNTAYREKYANWSAWMCSKYHNGALDSKERAKIFASYEKIASIDGKTQEEQSRIEDLTAKINNIDTQKGPFYSPMVFFSEIEISAHPLELQIRKILLQQRENIQNRCLQRGIGLTMAKEQVPIRSIQFSIQDTQISVSEEFASQANTKCLQEALKEMVFPSHEQKISVSLTTITR